MPSKRAKEIAARCADAYSADAYRSWGAVADALLKRGYSDQECEAIMRSKWTRWARDGAMMNYQYGKYPASVVLNFLDDERNQCTREKVAKMTLDTFGG